MTADGVTGRVWMGHARGAFIFLKAEDTSTVTPPDVLCVCARGSRLVEWFL